MGGTRASRAAAPRRLTRAPALPVVVAADPRRPRVVLPGSTTASPDEALRAVEDGAAPDVIVLDPSVPEPIAYAQRVHRLDRAITLVLVAEPERVTGLRQALQVAPLVGPDVTCLSTADADLLAADVADVSERAAQRRRFRATLSSASAQIAAATVHGSTEATRFASKILDDAPLAVVAVDGEGTIVGWNRRATDLFGRPEREALGRPVEPLFTPESQARLRALLDAPTTPDGRPAAATLEFEAADGVRYLDVTASALPAAPSGDGALLMLQDETDRVVAEREREVARAELAFLVEAGRMLAASNRFEETVQTLAELAVPSFADWCVVDLVEGDEIRRVAAAARDPELAELVHELQVRYPPSWDSPQPAAIALRNGDAVLLQVDADRLRTLTFDDAHYELMQRIAPGSAMAVPMVIRGETLGVLNLVRSQGAEPYTERSLDLARRVTERAAMALDNARLLKTAQERARAARVLDAVGDGVFLVDRARQVQLWNPAAERITGVAAGEVHGRRLGDVLPGWTAVEASIPVAAVGEPTRTVSVPLEIVGGEIWIAVAAFAVEEGVVYAFRDTTEEVALERMKSDFVATVSHELRTPLASVYGAALTLDRPDIVDDVELQRELKGVIVQESARLARIVEDILLASSLDAGALPVTATGVDARATARQVVDAVRANLADGDRLRLVAETPAEIVGDADRVRQVLGNLIENALKYSPSEAPVEVEVEAARRVVRLRVRDHGPGIPPQERARIFEKFYRLDPDQTSGVGGTGLGLYISRELVRRMGGRIIVEEPDGGGAAFVVELPRAD